MRARRSTSDEDRRREALAGLAREDVPDEVAAAYSGERLTYGPDYIIPAPFDPRLIWAVPSAVARRRWIRGGASRSSTWRPISAHCAALDPTAAGLELIFERVRAEPKRVVFAEGEEEKTIRAALLFAGSGYGTPVLVGREDRIKAMMATMGLSSPVGLEIHNARLSHNNQRYTDFLYQRQQRQGMLYRDCQRLVNQDRKTVFAACMVACGDADAMVTRQSPATRSTSSTRYRSGRGQAGQRRLRPHYPTGQRAHRAARRHLGP